MQKIFRKKHILRWFACLLLALFLPLRAAAETPYDSYTYWNNDQGVRKLVSNRPMYEPLLAVRAEDFGEAEFESLSDVYTDKDGMTYLLDSGRGLLYMLDAAYKPAGVIRQAIVEGIATGFAGAKGVFVANSGDIYLADTQNARVLVMDRQGVVRRTLTLPDSGLLPEDFLFRPSKVAVDSRGYAYVLSEGSYYGALVYAPEGSFGGFYGSNKVYGPTIGIISRLSDRLFSNNEKRGGQMRKLPYQFTDLTVDKEGYIYTATGRIGTTTQTGQIKRLNAAGSNILVNSDVNFADEGLLTLLNKPQAQDLLSLEVDTDGFIYALDSVFGRVFVYDVESNLLTAFGGGLSQGDQLGTFQQAVAIAATQQDVLVADSAQKALTVFRMNDYGKAVRECQLMTLGGNYEKAKPAWEAILRQDRGNQLAYQGLAQAAIIEADYGTAMQYAKIADNRELYSQAYQYVRDRYVRQNFVWLFPTALAEVCALAAWLICTTKRRLILVRNPALRELGGVSVHPFRVYGEMKEKKRAGAPLICGALMLLLYILSVLEETAGGFLFTSYDAVTFNSLLVFARTVGLILLWVVVNWAVASLFEGKGRLRDILTVVCYSLLPLLLIKLLALPLSHVMLLEEGTFLQLLQGFGVLFTLLLITIGTMIMHDFSLWKFIWTSLLTVFGIAIIVFVLFMIVILLRQGYGFLLTVFSEAIYR